MKKKDVNIEQYMYMYMYRNSQKTRLCGNIQPEKNQD